MSGNHINRGGLLYFWVILDIFNINLQILRLIWKNVGRITMQRSQPPEKVQVKKERVDDNGDEDDKYLREDFKFYDKWIKF